MIRTTLAILMAQRNERQDEISEITGISKATLSNIANNKTAGIQYEILDKLALYFGIPVSELFEYYPLSVEPYMYDESHSETRSDNQEELVVRHEIDDRFPDSKFYFGMAMNVISNSMHKTSYELNIEVPYMNQGVVFVRDEDNILQKIQNTLPLGFKKQLTNQIQDFIQKNFAEKISSDGFTGTLTVYIGTEYGKIKLSNGTKKDANQSDDV
ncbi:XRE family transcriptional regulator [Weissella confusa]|uniref:helix-turn-helix domain-containing protein n=1 Tax=Weissella confusa TaxID=1583 RepID=UPI00223B389E|nr:helix-turn-helix transcriptional regulator [Weissella confusa]MCT0008825.1 XRE family transcriptional regulator [Weissella confusa]